MHNFRLEQIPFFSKLSKNDIELLESISVRRKYNKSEMLFIEGEQPKWLFFLLSGSVRLFKSTQKGKEIFMYQMPPMNFIAEIANFENIPYPASAIFSISGEILKIDYLKFKQDFLSKPIMSELLLKSLSEKLKIASNLLHQELILTSEAKVAKFILEHEDLFNTLRHTKIASILNIAPETFSRILNKLKSSEIIMLDENNRIIGKNTDELSILCY